MAKKAHISIDELKKKYWLFDRMDVKLTGRTATKEYGRTKEYLFEIYFPNTQNNNTQKKWVRLADLWLVRSGSERVYVPMDLIDAVRKVVAEG